MTARMAQLLAYLRQRAEGPTMPSFVEMKEAIGETSNSGIFRLLDALEARGLIERDRTIARSIRLLDQPIGHIRSDVLVAELLSRGWGVTPPVARSVSIKSHAEGNA